MFLDFDIAERLGSKHSKEHWLEETISDCNESRIQMMRLLVHDFCKLTVKLQEICHDKQFQESLSVVQQKENT